MPTPESSTEEQILPVNAGAAEEAENLGAERAEPSTAETEGDKPKGSLLDAVKAALKPAPSAEETPASEDQEDEDAAIAVVKPGETPGEAEGDGEELNEDDLARLSKKTRKSVRRLLRDRAGLRGELDEVRPQAEQFAKIQRFVDEAGLAPQEVSAGFNIMRLMKSDPDKALETLAPMVEMLMKATGRLIPADLQEQVRNGQISPQAAQELSQTRARAHLSQNRERQANETLTQREQSATQRQAIDVMSNAVTAREQHWRTSDPDYAVKAARVIEKVKLAIHEGRRPVTPEQAVALVDECKATVDKELKRYQPRRTAISPVAGGGSSPSAAPRPTSTLDAIRRVVAA